MKIKVERTVLEKRPLRIVADGGISRRGAFGGRFVPLVILDTTSRPEVDECIRVHQASQTPGDALVQWGQVEGETDAAILVLKFIRPSEVAFVIEFEVVKHGILVFQALAAKGLFIQAGREGDRFKNDLHRPKVLVEIVETGYEKIWPSVFQKQLIKKFRGDGLNRSQSRHAASLVVKEFIGFGKFRLREIPASGDTNPPATEP